MNKTVIVTGGSRGIGKAICKEFAKSQYNVVINYNESHEKAMNLLIDLKKTNSNIIALKADISKPRDCEYLIKKTIDEFGKIDVLVNNAGICEQKLFTEISVGDWHHMINVNLFGTFCCTQLAVKNMLKNHRGKIINMSSIWGLSGASCEVHYSASKAGVIGLTKALAKELAPSNIQVNCIAPGVINTKMNANLTPDEISELTGQIPLGRFGEPHEVAKTALFLASTNANYITGQVITVSGGFLV